MQTFSGTVEFQKFKYKLLLGWLYVPLECEYGICFARTQRSCDVTESLIGEKPALKKNTA